MKDIVRIYLHGNPSFKVPDTQLILFDNIKFGFKSFCKGGLTIFLA